MGKSMFFGLLLALASFVSAQESGKPFSFKPSQVGAKAVIEELSKIAGVKLTVAKAVENDPLYVRVESVTLDDLMKKIAIAVSGDWEKTTDGFRLNRTMSLRNQQYQAYLAKRTEQMSAGLRNYVKENGKEGKWDVETVTKLIAAERKMREEVLKQEGPLQDPNARTTVSFSGSEGNSPAGVALFSMVPKLNARELAELPPNGRWVYASDPTRMQKLFRFDITDAMNRFVGAHNLLADLAGNDPNQNPKVHFSGGLDLNAKKITGPIGKMLLIASRSGSSDSIGLQAKFFDAEGKLIDQAQTAITLAPPKAATETKITLKTDPIALSTESQELKKLLGGMDAEAGGNRQRDNFKIAMMGPDGDVMEASSGASGQAMPISAGLLQKLSTPESNDPLSFFAKEALDQSLEGNVVACLPDDVVAQMARQNPVSLNGINGLTVTQEGRWTVISAADPYVSENNRADRTALGMFLRATLSKGYADLSEMGALSLSQTDELQPMGLVSKYLKLITPEASVVYTKLFTDSRGMVQLYGTLSSDQKKLLEAGQGIVSGTFDKRQNSLISGLVFGAYGTRIFQGNGRSINISQSSGDEVPPDTTETLASEKTEAFPNGVPTNASLSMQFQSREAVFSKLANARDGRFFTGGELGMQQAMADKLGTDIQANVSLPTYTKFRAASITKMPWILALGPEQNERGSLSNASVQANSIEGSLEQMPEAFRKAVQAGIDAMKNVKMNTMRFGGAPPPIP